MTDENDSTETEEPEPEEQQSPPTPTSPEEVHEVAKAQMEEAQQQAKNEAIQAVKATFETETDTRKLRAQLRRVDESPNSAKLQIQAVVGNRRYGSSLIVDLDGASESFIESFDAEEKWLSSLAGSAKLYAPCHAKMHFPDGSLDMSGDVPEFSLDKEQIEEIEITIFLDGERFRTNSVAW